MLSLLCFIKLRFILSESVCEQRCITLTSLCWEWWLYLSFVDHQIFNSALYIFITFTDGETGNKGQTYDSLFWTERSRFVFSIRFYFVVSHTYMLSAFAFKINIFCSKSIFSPDFFLSKQSWNRSPWGKSWAKCYKETDRRNLYLPIICVNLQSIFKVEIGLTLNSFTTKSHGLTTGMKRGFCLPLLNNNLKIDRSAAVLHNK